MLSELIAALGWQGGTIHQALLEVQRLKRIEKAARDLMDQLSFRAAIGSYRPSKLDEAKLYAMNKAFDTVDVL